MKKNTLLVRTQTTTGADIILEIYCLTSNSIEALDDSIHALETQTRYSPFELVINGKEWFLTPSRALERDSRGNLNLSKALGVAKGIISYLEYMRQSENSNFTFTLYINQEEIDE